MTLDSGRSLAAIDSDIRIHQQEFWVAFRWAAGWGMAGFLGVGAGVLGMTGLLRSAILPLARVTSGIFGNGATRFLAEQPLAAAIMALAGASIALVAAKFPHDYDVERRYQGRCLRDLTRERRILRRRGGPQS